MIAKAFLLPAALLLPIQYQVDAQFFTCNPGSNRIRTNNNNSVNSGCNDSGGRVRLIWKTWGFENDGWDEFYVKLRNNGREVYSSSKIKPSSSSTVTRNKSGIVGSSADGNSKWTVEFRCALQWLFHNNDCHGNFEWRLVHCGCPRDKPVMISECTDGGGEPDNAQGSVCREPECDFGEYSDDGTCRDCAPGTAKDAQGPQACTVCPAGTFSPGLGNRNCLPCPAGQYQDRSGQSSCNFCPAGTFSTGNASECESCPLQAITANALIDYTGAASAASCGSFRSTGYWVLAQQGAVGPGGTNVAWELTKTQAVSEGVESTDSFAEEFSQAIGESTYFESSVATGFKVGFSSDIIPITAEASIEVTETSGQETSFEVTETATKSIALAVSNVITNEESIACSQQCLYDPANPEKVNGFIYNWVEGIFDEEKMAVVHFVRTCRTWCKYDSTPPLCPPGYCANADCDRCLQGAYANPALDRVASAIEEVDKEEDITLAPVTAPTDASVVDEKVEDEDETPQSHGYRISGITILLQIAMGSLLMASRL